ncbi:FAD-binding domain-containing protein [Xylona heveae TC161]|uniref:FAD-binding domain-containing protein n=1 Tax=Xylona heveae (strain CBS 132557 / TC161) TaxID=1328760 RepID=A0A165I7A1_XYLHT|nr:FAD-binding domain-containing protein [Xylona heveae TC161]KZF24489.1 FAD-binding domain-containing protein [Xylona heveae TC161]
MLGARLNLAVLALCGIFSQGIAVNRFGGNVATPNNIAADVKSVLGPKLSQNATIALPGEPLFDELITRYSDYDRPTFSVSIAVATKEDVQAAVAYARSKDMPFLVQSGGHGLTTSTQTVQNGMQISMRRLNYTIFDPETEIMRVGGGAVTGELANASYALGYEVTVGSCPCTGVMGVGLGAGIGRLQGMYGLLMDNIVAITMMLPDGTIERVTAESNPDLWWAVRGAGHNFGIALEAEVQLHPQVNDGMHYVADMEFPISKTVEVFKLLNLISANEIPKQLAFFITGHAPGPGSGVPVINIDFVWHGTKESAREHLQPWLDLKPLYKKEEYVNWASLPWVTYGGLNNILCSQPGGQRNFYAANAATYDISAMASLWNDWEKMSIKYNGTAKFLLMFQTFAQQAVKSVDPDSSAFPWRKGSEHFLLIQASYTDLSLRAELDIWLRQWQTLFVETSGYGRLQQYVNYGHGYRDPMEALYGYDRWRIEKLYGLKEKYDPDGLFDSYQPIRTDKASLLAAARPQLHTYKPFGQGVVDQEVLHTEL